MIFASMQNFNHTITAPPPTQQYWHCISNTSILYQHHIRIAPVMHQTTTGTTSPQAQHLQRYFSSSIPHLHHTCKGTVLTWHQHRTSSHTCSEPEHTCNNATPKPHKHQHCTGTIPAPHLHNICTWLALYWHHLNCTTPVVHHYKRVCTGIGIEFKASTLL